MIKHVLILNTIINFSLCHAWDGYNWETNMDIKIEKGLLVRSGLDIEVYHWNTGEYHNEEVLSITSGEVETYDNDTSEYNVYEMK